MLRRKEDNSLKNLVFWNRNNAENAKAVSKGVATSAPNNDAQILKEISTIIKKMQTNGEKPQDLGFKPMKVGTIKNNVSDKASEESTKTTFENNFSEKSPKTVKTSPMDPREEKSRMALEALKLKNNMEMFPEKVEIARQFANFKTQIDFFRNRNIINDTAMVRILA